MEKVGGIPKFSVLILVIMKLLSLRGRKIRFFLP